MKRVNVSESLEGARSLRRVAALVLLWGMAVASPAQIHSFTVTPGALSFTALDPDAGGPVPQVSLAYVDFRANLFQAWRLYVQAEMPLLENCATVPVSALQVRCQSATITGFLNLGSAACNSATIPLSTSPQLVAQGNQGIFNNQISANLQVGFADRWRYAAAVSPACSVSLRYTVDIP
ncbi:MAG: hypothetical protein M9913_13730 [Bryobacteraceae bacterium]|nr:hypothetical protein [Solibacteraceae bacterium]MCO5351935.1 hypothetical protein [Bryobacteraceae bacterium]